MAEKFCTFLQSYNFNLVPFVSCYQDLFADYNKDGSICILHARARDHRNCNKRESLKFCNTAMSKYIQLFFLFFKKIIGLQNL